DPSPKVLIYAVRDEKLCIFGPSVAAFGEPAFVIPKRFAMRFRGVLLVRRAVADVAVKYDEGVAPLVLPKDIECVLDAIDIVRIAQSQDVPTVRQKPGRDVFCKGNIRVPFDGDAVVVVNPAEIVEAEMCGQGCSFGRNTLHHATVPAYGINL